MQRTNFRPMTKEEMEAAWGGPLPEVEPVYYEMAKDFIKGRQDFAPYVMKRIFTLEEAQIAMALPGTAEEVAAKLGMDPERVDKLLYDMYMVCKVIKNSSGYVRHSTIPFFRNLLFTQTYDTSYCSKENARLFNAWDATIRYEDGIAGGREDQAMRIVPKWESIKDIPGVMPCENVPESLREHYDKLRFRHCCCREVTSYAKYGKPYQLESRTGVNNTDMQHGVCIGAVKSDDYYESINCAYHPTREELEEHIKFLESHPVYYMAGNIREIKSVCSCCDDVDCNPRRKYELGDEEFYAKSRFLATVAKPDKCVGCGQCEKYCQFKKSIHLVDGKPVVDEDRCHGCGVCVTMCPTGAIKMKLVRPASHIPEELPVSEFGWGINLAVFD